VLERLRGIGRYTAGAVACFGYHRDAAFLDTNIRRVLHRVYLGPEVPAPRAGERQLWTLAAEALPPGQGYTWNQALMDLGAMICTATRPLCAACPLVDHCRAAPTFLRYGLPERAHRALREQAAAYRPSIPFKQTSRYFRGRIIDALRALPPEESVTLTELGPRVREDYDANHEAWLRGLVDNLVRDGLVSAAGPPDAPRFSLPH
jgi:A/G-specific adenine glycosylase